MKTTNHAGAVGAEQFWSASTYGELERYNNLSILRNERNGAFYAVVLRGNARKAIGNYRFKTVEQREKWIAEQKATSDRAADFKATRKAQRATAKDAPNPFKVGTVLVHSWGYDQTNVDFVEVVEVLPRSVRVRPIGSNLATDSGCGPMSGQVSPARGKFTGPARLLRLTVQTHTGTPQVSGAGEFHLADRASYYCSWYA